jgi:hypothetical protein
MLVALAATQASAMYTPNPAARWKQNRVLLAGDFQYMGEKDIDGGGEIEDEYGLFVRGAYSFAPNAVVYGRLGVQDADSVEEGFALGLGLQAAWELPGAPDWAIGGSFDYLWWDLEANNGADIDYHEFQLAPAVSYNVPQARALTPYAGIALDFITDDLEEDDPVGLFLGSNIDIGENWRLDGQVRFVHEEGFFFSAGYLF